MSGGPIPRIRVPEVTPVVRAVTLPLDELDSIRASFAAKDNEGFDIYTCARSVWEDLGRPAWVNIQVTGAP